jgi:hypothetical protein
LFKCDTAFLKFEIPLAGVSEVKLYDGSGTEVVGDVFEEVVKRPDFSVFKLTLNNDAKGTPPFTRWGSLNNVLVFERKACFLSIKITTFIRNAA